MHPKAKLSFAGLALTAGGFLAGLTLTGTDGVNTTTYDVPANDIPLIGFDYAEAQRRANAEAGNDLAAQSWLHERLLFEAVIAHRELHVLAYGEPPEPEPDPPDVEIPPDETPYLAATMPADSPVGTVSEIAYGRTYDGRYMIFAGARLGDGWRLNMHLQDTTVWTEPPDHGVVAGMSMSHPLPEHPDSRLPMQPNSVFSIGDPEGDAPVYWTRVYADLVPGRLYRAEAWSTLTRPDGSTERGDRQRLFITRPASEGE